jgi:hypothetical protein
MKEDTAKHCHTCIHMRERLPTDVKVEAGYDHAHHWCAKNDIPTLADALRCGGDDWAVRQPPGTRREEEEELKFLLQVYKARHGVWNATELLIGHLVAFQREGTITKADYVGNDFKVTIRTKK